MAGYWNRPEDTAKAFIERNGRRWLRTGDIVRMDEEGYFHFYDRSKDLIKFKGYSIFAKDVEDVLYGHPQVKAAGVIGVSDPAVGQRIKAIVVLQGDARGKVSADEIKAYCRQTLAEYKVPHIVEFRGELPKTDVGKISRRELRDETRSALGALAAPRLVDGVRLVDAEALRVADAERLQAASARPAPRRTRRSPRTRALRRRAAIGVHLVARHFARQQLARDAAIDLDEATRPSASMIENDTARRPKPSTSRLHAERAERGRESRRPVLMRAARRSRRSRTSGGRPRTPCAC